MYELEVMRLCAAARVYHSPYRKNGSGHNPGEILMILNAAGCILTQEIR